MQLGIRAAAPAVTALLLASLILGLVGRTLPQLNVLSMGFGLNAMLAFAALGLTLGAADVGLSGSDSARVGDDFRRPANAAAYAVAGVEY